MIPEFTDGSWGSAVLAQRPAHREGMWEAAAAMRDAGGRAYVPLLGTLPRAWAVCPGYLRRHEGGGYPLLARPPQLRLCGPFPASFSSTVETIVCTRCFRPHHSEPQRPHPASSDLFWPQHGTAGTSGNLPGHALLVAAKSPAWWGRNCLENGLGGARRSQSGGAETSSRNQRRSAPAR